MKKRPSLLSRHIATGVMHLAAVDQQSYQWPAPHTIHNEGVDGQLAIERSSIDILYERMQI